MKHIVESVEEMYYRREPTGEVIVDEVVDAVRKTKTQRASDIALLLDVEHRLLNDAFKMLTGMNLSTMIIEWRMLQAKELLDRKDLSVQEVANRCGFKQQKNLILAFRRRWGTTPQAYRTGKLIRNSNYVVNKDPRSRKNALDVAKEHLSQTSIGR
jgi:AraC-like DNA-binding protein